MKSLVRALAAATVLVVTSVSALAEQVYLRSSHSGLYVSSLNGQLAANSRDPARALRLETVRLSGNQMAFRDLRSGRFVRAGVGQGTFLAATSPYIRGWETFEVFSQGGGRVALRSAQNGKYVRAGVGRNSLLAAVSTGRPNSWETFQIVPAAVARPTPQGQQNNGSGIAALVGNYRITHVAVDNGHLVQLGQEIARNARLSIDGTGVVRASVGCNNMEAQISVSNSRVQLQSGVLQTKMRCRTQALQIAERGVARALRNSRTVVRSGRTIIFRGSNGSDILRIYRL